MPFVIPSIKPSISFIFRSKNSSDSALNVINECICDLQGLFAQYIVLAAEKHKRMKECHLSTKTEKQSDLFNDLDLYLNETIEKAFGIAQKYLIKYFHDRSKYSPRITIKAPYENENIVDIYRKDKSPYSHFTSSENTAFQYIKDTGKFYICNDIPKAIMDGTYKNKRINNIDVKAKYKIPGIFKKFFRYFFGQPERDAKWESYWNPRSYTESCYKSTLVIPMTLINADLNREFKEYILGESSDFNIEKCQKLMFAFLCVDHRHTDYFNEDSDIKIGYIIADILSLFLVARSMYTLKSKTFNKIREIITTT